MCDRITYDMINSYSGKIKITKPELKSFVRVRSNRKVTVGKITYLQVPDNKDQLLRKLVAFRTKQVNPKVYKNKPEKPEKN